MQLERGRAGIESTDDSVLLELQLSSVALNPPRFPQRKQQTVPSRGHAVGQSHTFPTDPGDL